MDKEKNSLIWIWLSIIVLAADQVIKYIAVVNLPHNIPVSIWKYLNLTLEFNTGAAFSLFAGASGWQWWLLNIVAIVVGIIILNWLAKLSRSHKWTAAALALIFGGALGNVVDRLVHGHVIDFIDFHYKSWHWPAFNVADSAIVVGAIMLFLVFLSPAKNK